MHVEDDEVQKMNVQKKSKRWMLDAEHPSPGSTRTYILKNEKLGRLKLQLINNEINLADYLESAFSFSFLTLYIQATKIKN